ncbi:MAG TPA: LysM domain-containing protein [Patescibacteria group bacterium]|nr:LysM domain-containing protein [Patescibacteria group bacterium]
MMRFFCGLLLGLLLCLGTVYAASRDNAPARYEICQVAPGDSVWSIAARLAAPREDVRELVFAIREINQLDKNARIQPGQVLKIPVREFAGKP